MTSLSHDMSFPSAGSAAPYLATATAFVLSFSAGALDAFAFLKLREVFAANVTMVGVSVAVLAFAVTAFVGFRLTDVRGERRPLRLPALLWVAVSIQGAVLIACVATAGTVVGALLLVIALSAAALALQTAGARRITESAGAVMTGAVPDGHVWMRLGSIPTLVAGAVLGIAIVTAAPAVALPLSAVAAIVAVALVRRVDLHRR